MYRHEAVSIQGFVQQLAVAYVTHGYWFYVTGRIPAEKDPTILDRKLIAQYGLSLSRPARWRRKQRGLGNSHYLRHGSFFVLIATEGQHLFKLREADAIQDIRREPIQFAGYSIGYKRGVDRKWHASVRIAPEQYRDLKATFFALACHRSVEKLFSEFQRIRFEPYAPVRRQLLNILRAVNRARQTAGFELVPVSALRLRRRIVRPFGEEPLSQAA